MGGPLKPVCGSEGAIAGVLGDASGVLLDGIRDEEITCLLVRFKPKLSLSGSGRWLLVHFQI